MPVCREAPRLRGGGLLAAAKVEGTSKSPGHLDLMDTTQGSFKKCELGFARCAQWMFVLRGNLLNMQK